MRVLRHTDAVAGKNIVLSLDIKLQEAAEDALGDRRGSIIALDPKTGEVLAMVSKPSFDPQPVRDRHQLQKTTRGCAIPSTNHCSTAPCAGCTRRARPSSPRWRLPAWTVA